MQPYINPYYLQQPIFQQQQQQIPNVAPVFAQNVNARMIDSIENISANDVPMQGISVFPKNDLSEVYIKSWQPNGTISTIKYVKQPDTEALTMQANKLTGAGEKEALTGYSGVEEIMTKLNSLEEKVDRLYKPKKKEVEAE